METWPIKNGKKRLQSGFACSEEELGWNGQARINNSNTIWPLFHYHLTSWLSSDHHLTIITSDADHSGQESKLGKQKLAAHHREKRSAMIQIRAIIQLWRNPAAAGEVRWGAKCHQSGIETWQICPSWWNRMERKTMERKNKWKRFQKFQSGTKYWKELNQLQDHLLAEAVLQIQVFIFYNYTYILFSISSFGVELRVNWKFCAIVINLHMPPTEASKTNSLL